MSTKPEPHPPRVRIELLKPHRHAGRDYKPGQYLELPEEKAAWLVSVGTAKAVPASAGAPATLAAKKE